MLSIIRVHLEDFHPWSSVLSRAPLLPGIVQVASYNY
jgi:hypothetical protein